MSSSYSEFNLSAGRERNGDGRAAVCLSPCRRNCPFLPDFHSGVKSPPTDRFNSIQSGARADDAGDFQPRRRRFHFHPNCPSVGLSGSCQSASNNRGSDFSLSGMLIPTSPEEGRQSEPPHCSAFGFVQSGLRFDSCLLNSGSNLRQLISFVRVFAYWKMSYSSGQSLSLRCFLQNHISLLV